MKKLIFFLLLASCSLSGEKSDKNDRILNFHKELSFEEFNTLVKKYADINPYPNIDK
jgi:hypothetical protein